MLEWWNTLNGAAQIFYCFAVPATLVLFVQTVMLFLGLGDDADVDAPDLDSADGLSLDVNDGVFGDDSVYDPGDPAGLEGLRIFTVRGIVAFFVVFGWVGVVMQSASAELWLTVLISAVCGFAMMVLMAYLFRLVLKLRSDGNADNHNAIGTAGRVQLTIPASRTGEGKVHVMLQGSYVERDAVTDQNEPIPTGAEIVVIGVSGQTTLVVRTK